MAGHAAPWPRTGILPRRALSRVIRQDLQAVLSRAKQCPATESANLASRLGVVAGARLLVALRRRRNDRGIDREGLLADVEFVEAIVPVVNGAEPSGGVTFMIAKSHGCPGACSMAA